MELTLGSETSAFKTQTPGNNPEDYTLYSQHGESLKSTIDKKVCSFLSNKGYSKYIGLQK
jgi:hypothetical protein